MEQKESSSNDFSESTLTATLEPIENTKLFENTVTLETVERHNLFENDEVLENSSIKIVTVREQTVNSDDTKEVSNNKQSNRE